MTAHDILRAALAKAAASLGAPTTDILLERPKDPTHGDVATNLAMTLARTLKAKPRDVATKLIQALDLPAGVVKKTEIAGPGFINFLLAETQLADVLGTVLAQGERYGKTDAGKRQSVNVEFVSANPTGPLHVGHGRQAAIGDAIATLLEWTGWRVTREFYYNDAGTQIANLAKSVQARIKGSAIPEGGYHGEYVKEIAERYVAEHPGDKQGDGLDAIRVFAVAELRNEQDSDLQAFGVKFDVYFLESSLYTDGRVEQTVKRLEAAGHTFEEDGALWLRTTDFGDDKDRVMKKSAVKGGEYTYFVPDVAYHADKWERGFQVAIDVQGADHHSTVKRVHAGLEALDVGITPQYPEYVLHQMVTVMKGGAEMKISKRAGSYLTLRELIDEVGRDAVRFFLLMRHYNTHLVFDVDLAKKQTEENPVFYVQMAHARMSGIFRVADRAPESASADGVDLGVLTEELEVELIKDLQGFRDLVSLAAERRVPHMIVGYLQGLATHAHAWYHKFRVLGDPEEAARLVLARAVRQVLANGLSIIGVSAPDRM